MVNMLKALMGKENSMQEKIIYVSREMKTLKSNSKEMLELET